MIVDVLCSDNTHPITPFLIEWKRHLPAKVDCKIFSKKNQLREGKLLLLISCAEVLSAAELSKYDICLVLHASDLPLGRGWSPFIHEIRSGKSSLVVTLLEAATEVDTGRIWAKRYIDIPRNALFHESSEILFTAEIELINYAIENLNTGIIKPSEQSGKSTYFERLTPKDSELDINLSIAEQFDKMRSCDPDRFPCVFEIRGRRFKLFLDGEI